MSEYLQTKVLIAAILIVTCLSVFGFHLASLREKEAKEVALKRNAFHMEFFMGHDFVVRGDCFVHSPECWECLTNRKAKEKAKELEDIKF